MKKFTALLLAGTLLACAAAPAFAQSEDRRALVEELLILTNVKENVKELSQRLKDMQMAQIEQMDLPSEKADEARQLQDRIMTILFEELSWDNMKEDFIELYASVFTEEEIKAMLGFYRSPAGQKLNRKMPEIMEKSMVISQKHVRRAAPRVQGVIEEFLKKNQAGAGAE